ncbi:TcpF, partial [Clostridium perfringens]|nr:TcpF [Clostridium perfringens]
FLAINNIPSIEFPGVEYIKLIQDMNMNSEICIHVKKFSTDGSRKKVKGKSDKIKAQINEALEGGHIPSEEENEALLAAEEFTR